MTHSTCLLSFDQNAQAIRTSLSAIRHIGDYLWLGCDETATLERLTLDGDRATDHRHFAVSEFLPLPNPDDEEIDIEGIAFNDHYLWFVGSHSLKRKRVRLDKSDEDNVKRLRKIERESNRYTLGRIPCLNGELVSACPHPNHPDQLLTAAQLKRKKNTNELMQNLEEDRHLGEFIKADIPGKDNGFDVEGLAVLGDRLLLGLRGPVLRGWAVFLELHLEEAELGVLRLQKHPDSNARYRKHFVDLGGLGIRDLCLWNDKLLILAGPTLEMDGSIRVLSLPLASLDADSSLLKPSLLWEVPHGKGCDRAEGITLVSPDQKELLVVYDAPSDNRLQGDQAVLADRFPL